MTESKAIERAVLVWTDGQLRLVKTPKGKPVVETRETDALGGERWTRLDKNAWSEADDERLPTTRLARALIEAKEALVREANDLDVGLLLDRADELCSAALRLSDAGTIEGQDIVRAAEDYRKVRDARPGR